MSTQLLSQFKNKKMAASFLLAALLLAMVSLLLGNPTGGRARGKSPSTGAPLKPCVDSSPKQEGEDHYINIPYFIESEEMTSVLTINNNINKSISVNIVIFDQQGESLPLPAIALQADQLMRFSVGALIKDATARGNFASGNIQIHYRESGRVTSQLSVLSTKNRISFEVMAADSSMFASSRLDGIVWLPDSKTQGSVVLTNVSNRELIVETINDPGISDKVKAFTLKPRETRVVDVKEILAVRGVAPVFALLSLKHNGDPGDIIASGYLLNKKNGFSSSLTFADKGTAKSNQLAGAHIHFGQANSKEEFPEGTAFLAPLLIANISDVTVSVKTAVDYTIASESRRAELADITLAAREVKLVELSKELARQGIIGPVDDAGVDIFYSGEIGSVIGRLTSIDTTGDFSLDTPIKDPLSGAMRAGGSHPWRLDSGYSTTLHLKNTTPNNVEAIVQIRFDGGTYNPDLIKLAPYQTIAIDVRQLRDAQEIDIRGNKMPLNVNNGKLIWYERENDSLIGRAEVINVKAGMAGSFSCGNCPCSPIYWFSYLTPQLPPTIAYGQSVDFDLFEWQKDSCPPYEGSGQYGPYQISNGITWSSDHFNVTINGIGVAQGFFPGTDRVNGKYQTIFARGGYPDPCTPQYGYATASQDITILPKVTVTGAEMCADAIPSTLEPSSASGTFTLTLVSSAGSVNIVNESRNGGNYRDSFNLGTLPTRAFTSIQATWVSHEQTGTGSRSYSFTVLGDYLTTCYVTELESDYSGSTFTAGTATSSCVWSSRDFITRFLDLVNLNGSGIDSSNTALQLEMFCTGAPPTSPPYGGWRYRRPTTITTSCGNQPSVGTTIASPTLACGTLVRIDGLGCRRKQDTGNGLSSTQIDVYNGIGHSSCAGWSNIQRRVARID